MTLRSARLQRERDTIQAMVEIFCVGHHHSLDTSHSLGLCAECSTTLSYALQRIELCPHKSEKPSCANCRVHCYRGEWAQKIKQLMRYSGPKMIFKHPVLAFFHIWDSKTRRGNPSVNHRVSKTTNTALN
jgi:hypothetical protein